MRCDCGSPDANCIKEIDGELRLLCRNCAYRPDDCDHAYIAANIAEPMTANTKPCMVGICKDCLTVRELPSLTGDMRELFKKGRDLPDATPAQINGKWYVVTPLPLATYGD